MVHWFHGTYITPVNGLKTFYIDIKTIEPTSLVFPNIQNSYIPRKFYLELHQG